MIQDIPQLDLDFTKLPENIQNFVLSEEVAETVNVIAEEYLPAYTDSDEIFLLIFGLMIGSVSVDRFLQELRQTYHLEETRSEEMLLDINKTLLEPTSYLLNQAPTPSPVSHPVPSVSASQTPVSGLLQDHEHLAAHTHDGPVPLSKDGTPRNMDDFHNPHKDEPTYELK